MTGFLAAGAAALRSMVEGELVDACELHEADTVGAVDVESATSAVVAGALLWSGSALFTVTAGTVEGEGGRLVTAYAGQGRLPLDAPEPPAGSYLLVTASANPDLVGRKLHVLDAPATSLRASRVLAVQERR